MPNNLTWYSLPGDVFLWSELLLSLNGDEVMPLDCHAGRSGWLLYGRGLNKRRLTDWQRELGAVLMIVASWVAEDYQAIRLAGSLTPRVTRLAYEVGLDVTPLGEIPHLHILDLLVMDIDSTATQIECIDKIAKLADTGELVSEVTKWAIHGELDFTADLCQRVVTLRDTDATTLLQVRDALPLMPSLAQLVPKLETLDWKAAIAFGDLASFAKYLRDKLHLDVAFVNKLEIRDNKLIGNVFDDIVDTRYKTSALRKLTEKCGIPTAQTAAIGNGANDLPMIRAAGLDIAHHAKPKMSEQVEVTIRHADLAGIFCIFSGNINQK